MTGSFKIVDCSQNVIWVMKRRRKRWAGDVARMVKWRVAYKVLVERPEGN
jgi:hypothetical protein